MQIHHQVIDQSRLAEEGGHQDHHGLAVAIDRQQGLGIDDVDGIGAEALLVESLGGLLQQTVKIPVALAYLCLL